MKRLRVNIFAGPVFDQFFALRQQGRLKPARVLIVGEAPSREGDPFKPITGAIGDMIVGLAWPEFQRSQLQRFPTEYWRAFDRCNLLDRWPGYISRVTGSGGGSAFDAEAAHEAATRLLAVTRDQAWTHVVLLGRRVAGAVSGPVVDAQWFDWVPIRFPGRVVEVSRTETSYCESKVVHLAVCPHPSGLNRWWNQPANIAWAAAFWSNTLAIARGAQA